jgi:hypothetical protein
VSLPSVSYCSFPFLSCSIRAKREADFTRAVENIVLRGGNCLIPVFALGRAQELLLILEEYWKEHPRLQHIPILYASKLATRSLRVYQTFVNMMNQSVQALGNFSPLFHLLCLSLISLLTLFSRFSFVPFVSFCGFFPSPRFLCSLLFFSWSWLSFSFEQAIPLIILLN